MVAAAAGAGVPSATAADPAALLSLADGIKLADHSRFESIIGSLDHNVGKLSPSQRAYLEYLQGWDEAYRGHYPTAIATLTRIAAEQADETVRFRAGITLVNLLTIAGRYKEAYRMLGGLIDRLPDITDQAARQQAMLVAAFLYEEVGEYDLSMTYAHRIMRENWQGEGLCKGGQVEIRALYGSGRLKMADPELRRVVDACIRQRQLMFADESLSFAARMDFDHGEVTNGVALLRAHYDEVKRTQYSRLIALYDALLARGYLRLGEFLPATRFARAAIASSEANRFPQPLVTAYEVLYELAKARGDYRTALHYHERYAAADIAYLKDRAARGSAYDEVLRETATRKLEIKVLSRKNQLLELERKLAAKQVEATRLYGVILTLILIFIGLWALLTKRSQLHFKNLSRLDGLTGISNRLHFIERAETALAYARKSGQEVSLLLLDLDHFKSINDRFGHATGDFVLKQAVSLCRAHLRRSDIFGRFGGEEFSVLLPACGLEEARRQAEQLRETIGRDIRAEHRGEPVTASASFGVASSAVSGYELARLLAHADAALYRAKRAGRDCVSAYDTAESGEIKAVTPPASEEAGLRPDGSSS